MSAHRSLVALMFAAVVGCGWKGPLPMQTWPGVDNAEQHIALDKAAFKLVAVQTRSVSRTPGGQLQLRIELANLSSKDLPVQVQTLFRDSDGVPSGEDTPSAEIPGALARP